MTGHLYLNETKEKIKYLNEGSYKVYKVIFMNVTGWHIYTYSKSTVKTQDQGPLILFQCFDCYFCAFVFVQQNAKLGELITWSNSA